MSSSSSSRKRPREQGAASDSSSKRVQLPPEARNPAARGTPEADMAFKALCREIRDSLHDPETSGEARALWKLTLHPCALAPPDLWGEARDPWGWDSENKDELVDIFEELDEEDWTLEKYRNACGEDTVSVEFPLRRMIFGGEDGDRAMKILRDNGVMITITLNTYCRVCNPEDE